MSGCLGKPLSHPDCELDVLERAIERACGLVTAEDVQLDLDEPATARLLLDQQHRLAAEAAATEPPVDLDVVEKPDRLPWEALSKPDASDGLARLGLLNDEQLLPCDGTPFPNEHREVALRLLVGFLLSHACIVDQADQVAVSGRGHERREFVIGNRAQADRHAYFIQSRATRCSKPASTRSRRLITWRSQLQILPPTTGRPRKWGFSVLSTVIGGRNSCPTFALWPHSTSDQL